MDKALGYSVVSSALYVKKWYNIGKSFAVSDFSTQVCFNSWNTRYWEGLISVINCTTIRTLQIWASCICVSIENAKFILGFYINYVVCKVLIFIP